MRKIILALSLLITMTSFAQERNASAPNAGKTALPSIFGNTEKGKADQDNILKTGAKPANKINTNNYGISKTISTKREHNKIKKEPELYARIIKQYGWFKGYGKPLTKEEASHLTFYFRLSEMNEAGHWTKIEAFDGYHRLTSNHSMATYLVNQYDDNDSGADELWKERLKTICQWELVGDPKGKTVIQERAYDEDMNLIYCYTPVFIEKNKITGSYTDSWGMPVKMRKDSLEAGANYVHITYDEQGNEILYEYMDEQGYRAKNKDGAYMTKKEYDKDGLQIKEASCNAIGNYMIDDYGNCGWYAEYNKNGQQTSSCYYDNNWKPIRISASKSDNHIKSKYTYDEYGRLIKQEFLDENNKKDKNQNGVHCITNEYNEKGQVIKVSYFDINGNLTGSDSLNIAQIRKDYDKNGNEIYFELKNPQGNYVNNVLNCCKQVITYEGSETKSLQEYSAGGDSLYLTYDRQSYKDGKTIYKWLDKNICRIDSADSHGNDVLVEYYDLNGKPIMNGGYSKHYTFYEYDEVPQRSYEFYADTLNNYVIPDDQNWSIRTIAIDTVSRTKLITIYDNSQKVISSVSMKYDKGFNNILSQMSLNDFGKPSRTYYEGALYYNVRVSNNIYGNFSSFIGENEFGEPAYIMNNDAVYHYMRFAPDGKSYYCDENGNDIGDMEEFITNVPKAVCIQVIDTIGYTNLLKDGDILLKYGNWRYPQTCTEYNGNSENELNIETVLSAHGEKEIRVLRHNIKDKSSKVVSIRLPEGTPSELGFTTHQLCYTKKECERLETALNTYLTYNEEITVNADPSGNDTGKNEIILVLPTKSAYNNHVFKEKGLKDPAILIAFENRSLGNIWLFEEESSGLENLITYYPERKFTLRNLYLTTDGSRTDSIGSYARTLGIKFKTANVSDTNYERLKVMAKKWEKDNTKKITASRPTGIKKEPEMKKKENLSPIDIFNKLTKIENITTINLNKKSGNMWDQLTKQAKIFSYCTEVYAIICDSNDPQAIKTYQTVLGSLNKKKYKILSREENDKIILGELKGKKYDKLILFDNTQFYYLVGNFDKHIVENEESLNNLFH